MTTPSRAATKILTSSGIYSIIYGYNYDVIVLSIIYDCIGYNYDVIVLSIIYDFIGYNV